MRKPKKEIHLTSYEELLGIEDNQENSVDKITEIPIDCLYGFKNHPFYVINDEKMQETVDSIKEYGVLNPCIVRPREVVDMKSYLDIVENMHVNWQERPKYRQS